MGLLDHKVVIITACSRGIGLGIVKRFAKEGASVYMAIRNIPASSKEIEELKRKKYKINAVYWDASQTSSYLSMIDEVYKKEGHIDVLVNNYGYSDVKKDFDIEQTEYQDFIQILNDNLSPVYLLSKRVIEYMKKQENGGSIINISSIGGIIPDISRIAYSTSKAAINYLTKEIALMCARENIRCNAIAPGMIATDAVKNHMDKNFTNFFLKHSPIQRMGEVDEIAGTALYLASDYSKFTTGQIIEVTGGFGLGTPLFGDIKSK